MGRRFPPFDINLGGKIMAKQATKRTQRTSEKMSVRARRAYQRGYKQGFEDSAKNPTGSTFWGSRGYKKGYGDKKIVRKIEKKYNQSKNS